MTFSSFDLHPSLERGIADLGFTTPTPVQRDGIPPALAGRDVLACAMTGSGKTAAFLLPILQRLLGKKRGKTRALVLAPTRELAAQIVDHFNELARHTPLRAAAVFGGVGMKPQEQAFRRGVDLIVACPGRLLDHFQHPYARLADLEVLVLDEADRMLDMGFLPDIRRILDRLPQVDQTLFFSATVPPQIAALAKRMLRNPVTLDIERPAAPATGVKQSILPVPQKLKSALLLDILNRWGGGSVLVFTRTKHRANRLADYLNRHDISCDRIHGNRSQAQRTRALDGFRDGSCGVLVATDVAARGIDVEALSLVVNFDVPNLPEDYIHRVGRTARAGATGEALTFASPQEKGELRAIERAVGKQLPRRTLPGFDYEARAESLEIPLGQRIAAIRQRKAEERARRRAKEAKREGARPAASRPKRPSSQAAGNPSNGRNQDRDGRHQEGASKPPRRRRRRRGRRGNSQQRGPGQPQAARS